MAKKRRSLYGPKGYIYFVLCAATNLVKIGWSTNHPDCRLKAFRLGSGAALERFGYIRDDQTLERRLHARFKHLRSHGEWYTLDDDLRDYIDENAEPWRMVNRSCPEDHEQFKLSRENYDERATELVMEWSQTNCPMFSKTPPEECVDFFEFCLQRGFRFKRSDRLMVKIVKGKSVLYHYEYEDQRPTP